MNTRPAVIAWSLALASCSGHQTFDDGSDAVRQHADDAGSPRPDTDDDSTTVEPVQPNETNGDDDGAQTGNADDAGVDVPPPVPPVAVADAGSGATGSTLELDATAQGTTVEAVVNDELVLTLRTIGPGNYETPDITGDGSVELLSSEYAAVQNPGGPTQLFSFRAVNSGLATVSIPHTTGSTFVFDVTVE